MKVYKMKPTANLTLKKLQEKAPSITFEVVNDAAAGGFVIVANQPAHIQWGPEITSLLNTEGVRVDKVSAEAVETAPAPAAEEKVKKERKPREKKDPKPKVAWSVMWKDAPAKVAARVAAGKPPFKVGSKRDIGRQLLQKAGGTTVDEAMAALGWNKATVLSSFTEVATLLECKVVTTRAEGQPHHYTIVPTTQAEIDAARAARATRKIEVEKEKERKASEKAAKAAAAAAAAEAQKNASAAA
jgi:hypothetical protein